MGTIIYALWGFVILLDMSLANGNWNTITFGLYDDLDDIPLLIGLFLFAFNAGAGCYALMAIIGIFGYLPFRGMERAFEIIKRGLRAEREDKE